MFAVLRLQAPLLKTRLMARLQAHMLRLPAHEYASYREALRQLSVRDFLQASKDCGEFAMPANTASLPHPVLVVAGEREHPLIHQSMAALVGVLPHAEGRVVPQVGHGWNGEQPELFSAMVRAWATGMPLPPSLRAY